MDISIGVLVDIAEPYDTALRAITEDGAFRVITVRTTDTVQKAIEYQNARGYLAPIFGELITSTILVRQTMAPQYRVQTVLSDSKGIAYLVADSHPDGGARGLINKSQNIRNATFRYINRLQIMRTLMNGQLHSGMVQISEETGVSQAVMNYMANSEQIATIVAVSCIMDGQLVKASGGYIIQILPEVTQGPLERMVSKLQSCENVEQMLLEFDSSPKQLMNRLLNTIPYAEVERNKLCYRCRCSKVRALGSMATLGKQEIVQIINHGEALDITCEYCGHEYQINPCQLKGLLSDC